MKKIITKHYEATNEYGVRSSERTKLLHTDLAKYFANLVGDIEFSIEQQITDIHKSHFNVDIIGKRDGKICVVILIKSIMSSHNKNRHNYFNTIIGETCRLNPHIENGVKVLHFTLIPSRIPYCIKKVVKLETPKLLKEESYDVLKRQNNNQVEVLELTYDIDEKYLELRLKNEKNIVPIINIGDDVMENLNKRIIKFLT